MSVNITSLTQSPLPVGSASRPQSDPHDQSVSELVAAQAVATPNAIAVVAGNESITYGELDRRANQLANYLITLGVRPATIVGLCLERSTQSVMCALAVLKAGAAYLPLDPAYPTERLLFMLNDAQPRVLITQTGLTEKLSEGIWKAVTVAGNREIENYSNDAPANQVTPDSLAYVIYTSGSTGRPKGVEITHASLLNLVSWHRRAFGVTPDDRASHKLRSAFCPRRWPKR